MDLQALVDNELTLEERRALLSALEMDEIARERYQQLLNQKSIVRLWWANGARDH